MKKWQSCKNDERFEWATTTVMGTYLMPVESGVLDLFEQDDPKAEQ